MGEYPLARLASFSIPGNRDGSPMTVANRCLSPWRSTTAAPSSARMIVHGADGVPHRIVTTAIPLDGQGGALLGAHVGLLGRDRARTGEAMKVTFWGTRGSLPSPRPGHDPLRGQHVVRRGPHRATGRWSSSTPAAASTGWPDFGPGVTRVDVLLTHLHMDHILGLGFFGALFQPDLEVHIWGPPSATLDLRARLSRYLSPPLFPVRLTDLPCQLVLHDAPGARSTCPGASVTADLVCHPGPTLGYRHRSRRRHAGLHPRPRTGARRQRVPRLHGVDVGLPADGRRRPAHPRRPVHRRGVPVPRRLGPQHDQPGDGAGRGGRGRPRWPPSTTTPATTTSSSTGSSPPRSRSGTGRSSSPRPGRAPPSPSGRHPAAAGHDAGPPIEVVLLKQVAGYLAMPVFLVDEDGTLEYYNEPAEELLGQRYEETGQIPLEVWGKLWSPTDPDGRPLAPEELPVAVAVRDRRPVQGVVSIRRPRRLRPRSSPSPPSRSRRPTARTSAPSPSSGRAEPRSGLS